MPPNEYQAKKAGSARWSALPSITLIVDGVEDRFVPADVTSKVERFYFAQTGTTLRDLLAAVNSDPAASFAVSGMLFFAKRAAGEPVTVDECEALLADADSVEVRVGDEDDSPEAPAGD